MIKICEMSGVIEIGEGDPCELWLSDAGEMVVCAYNEGGANSTMVPLNKLMEWVRNGGFPNDSLGTHR